MSALTAPATNAALEQGANALFDLLAEHIEVQVQPLLFTVLAPSPGGRRLQRLYSSDQQNFPLSAADTVEDSRWFRRLFVDMQPIIANDPETILSWLPEWQSLIDMGFGSLVNMPLVTAGKAIGLINVMAAPGHFGSNRVDVLRAECPLAALAVMAALSDIPSISFSGADPSGRDQSSVPRSSHDPSP